MAATLPKEEWSLWHKRAIAHTQRTWPSKGWFLKLIQKTRHSFAFSLSWLDKRVLSEHVAKLSSLVLPSKTLLVAMQSNSVRKPVVLSPRRTFQERRLYTLSTWSAKKGADHWTGSLARAHGLSPSTKLSQWHCGRVAFLGASSQSQLQLRERKRPPLHLV